MPRLGIASYVLVLLPLSCQAKPTNVWEEKTVATTTSTAYITTPLGNERIAITDLILNIRNTILGIDAVISACEQDVFNKNPKTAALKLMHWLRALNTQIANRENQNQNNQRYLKQGRCYTFTTGQNLCVPCMDPLSIVTLESGVVQNTFGMTAAIPGRTCICSGNAIQGECRSYFSEVVGVFDVSNQYRPFEECDVLTVEINGTLYHPGIKNASYAFNIDTLIAGFDGVNECGYTEVMEHIAGTCTEHSRLGRYIRNLKQSAEDIILSVTEVQSLHNQLVANS